MIDMYDEGISFDYIDIDNVEYDREYCLTIDRGSSLSICKVYDYKKEIYLGFDGLTYVHYKVDPRMIKDVKNNVFIDDFRPILFCFSNEVDNIKEDDCEETDKYKNCEIERIIDGTRIVYCIPMCLDYLIDSFDEIFNSFMDDLFND